jgi:hypothetical protein
LARISELEQRGADTLEVAISQNEFDDLVSVTDPLVLRITILDDAGAEIGNFLLSTDQADWVQDPASLEYFLVEPITGFGNHRTSWDGLVLSSLNSTGLDTVEDGLMIGPFNEAVDEDGVLATTVTSATNIPVGTALTLIDQSVVVGTGSGATLRFDAPDIDTPIVSTDDDLGGTGTSPPVCFASGTLIRTADGDKRIETLKVDDLVVTQHNGLQRVKWIGHTDVSANDLAKDERMRPVRIGASALGEGLPVVDLVVTRQHRIVASSPLVDDLTGQSAVLIAAHRLSKLPRVSVVCPKKGITYFHLLFEKHEVIFANGMPAESLYLGNQARQLMSNHALIEIEEAGCAEYATHTALPVPDNKTQNEVVATHLKHGMAIHSATCNSTPTGAAAA